MCIYKTVVFILQCDYCKNDEDIKEQYSVSKEWQHGTKDVFVHWDIYVFLSAELKEKILHNILLMLAQKVVDEI